MAELGIENTTVGYSSTGITEFLNQLNLEVITPLVKEMRDSVDTINGVVDEVWAGQSALAFKEKFNEDTNTMADTLEKLRDEVEGQFAQIGQNVDNYDAAIAETIRNS